MIRTEVVITDPAGLHARPVSIITAEASKYQSSIMVEFGEKKANLKSLLSVMSLGVTAKSKISISAEGDDAETAISNLTELMKANQLTE